MHTECLTLFAKSMYVGLFERARDAERESVNFGPSMRGFGRFHKCAFIAVNASIPVERCKKKEIQEEILQIATVARKKDYIKARNY